MDEHGPLELGRRFSDYQTEVFCTSMLVPGSVNDLKPGDPIWSPGVTLKWCLTATPRGRGGEE